MSNKPLLLLTRATLYIAIIVTLTACEVISNKGESSSSTHTNSEIMAWGYNLSGQLGDGTLTNKTTPVKVLGLTGVTAISASFAYSLALKGNGTVWAWGHNQYGQLGDGTKIDRTTPVQVSELTGVTAISTCIHHSLALKEDGTVWAWGHNESGQLGDSTKIDRTTPVQVSGLTGVTAISAGAAHSIALKGDGSVWAWGENSYAQLGTGYAMRGHTTPVQIPGLTNITAISAGLFHSLALKEDRTVWSWGQNWKGQGGDGAASTNICTPVKVLGLSSVTAISAAGQHSLALKSGTSK
jgi:alpha-tubulin suppressor-like RCC1 family protein